MRLSLVLSQLLDEPPVQVLLVVIFDLTSDLNLKHNLLFSKVIMLIYTSGIAFVFRNSDKIHATIISVPYILIVTLLWLKCYIFLLAY